MPKEEPDWNPFLTAANAAGGVAASYDTSKLKDPYRFMFEYVRTLDPHDEKNPIKSLPDTPQTRSILRTFIEEDLIVIPKSRQMQATWMAVAYGLYMAMSRQGSAVFFVSRKEDDAGFSRDLSLLSRAYFIYSHLPQSLQIPCQKGLAPPVLRFPAQYSSIMGLTQDSDALRQYTASLVICDEWAFQEKARESYSAMIPTLKGGGKLIGISTPNGPNNLFFDLVHDRQQNERENTNYQIQRQHKGLLIEKNKKNGFSVIWLHYSADPLKDEKWARQEKKSMSSAEEWEREYEISFSTMAGLRVYPDFTRDRHVGELKPIDGKPIWRGWDFGFGHPAVVWCQLDHNGRLNILAEHMGHDITIENFADEVKKLSKKMFPYCEEWRDAGDSAGKQVSDKSERATIDILRKKWGIRIQSRKLPIKDGVDTIRRMILPPRGLDPKLRVDVSCRTLIDGFTGGFVRQEIDDQIPVKDGKYDHLMDALRYLVMVVYNPVTGAPIGQQKATEFDRTSANQSTGY